MQAHESHGPVTRQRSTRRELARSHATLCAALVGLGVLGAGLPTPASAGPSDLAVDGARASGPRAHARARLTICKYAGPGVRAGSRYRFRVNARRLTIAAGKKQSRCETLGVPANAKVRIDEDVPKGSRVAISTTPANALLRSDPVKRAAVVRLRRPTTIRFTNAVCDEAGAPGAPGAGVDVDEDRGPLSTLYPGLDTTTDAFYPLPCDPSIGGTLPPEVDDPPSQQEVDTTAAVT